MLADLAAWIVTHYGSLLLMMLAGACFVAAGMLAIFIWRRRDVVLGPVDAPTFTAPEPHAPPRPPKSHAAREDADTEVIPRIPGATPEPDLVDRMIALAVQAQAQPVCPFCGGPWHALCPSAPKERTEEEVAESAPIGRIPPYIAGPILRVIPSAELWPEEPKPPVDEPTQVVDLCPLTTQDLEIPTWEPPIAREVAAFRASRSETQDLTVRLDQIKDRERVA